MKTLVTAPTLRSQWESAALCAVRVSTRQALLLRVLREKLVQEAKGDHLAHLAEMAFQDNLVSLDPQAHLDQLALAETLLLRCLTVMMRNPLVSPCPALWVQWVPVVLLALLAHLDLKASKDPLVNLVNLVLLVLWDLVDPQDLQERMVKMVKLANPDVPVSVVPQAHRVLVVSQELLVFQA